MITDTTDTLHQDLEIWKLNFLFGKENVKEKPLEKLIEESSSRWILITNEDYSVLFAGKLSKLESSRFIGEVSELTTGEAYSKFGLEVLVEAVEKKYSDVTHLT